MRRRYGSAVQAVERSCGETGEDGWATVAAIGGARFALSFYRQAHRELRNSTTDRAAGSEYHSADPGARGKPLVSLLAAQQPAGGDTSTAAVQRQSANYGRLCAVPPGELSLYLILSSPSAPATGCSPPCWFSASSMARFVSSARLERASLRFWRFSSSSFSLPRSSTKALSAPPPLRHRVRTMRR